MMNLQRLVVLIASLLVVPSLVFGQNPYQRVDHSVTANPLAVTVADIDGDGDDDFVVSSEASSSSSGRVTIFLNNGDGTFAVGGGSPYDVEGASSSAVADLDGNGTMDVAVGSESERTVTLFYNDGAFGMTRDTLEAQLRDEDGFARTGVKDVVAADFDGDGDVDLVVSTNQDVRALTQQSGTFVRTDTHSFGDPHRGLAVGDFTGDGRADVAVAAVRPISIGILRNDSSGDNVQFTADSVSPWLGPHRLAIGDWDRDDDLDLVSAAGGSVLVYTNDGGGHFTETDTLTAPLVADGVVAGNFDGKVGIDIGASDAANNVVMFFLNDGSARFQQFEPNEPVSSEVMGTSDLAGGEFNGDGLTDLVVANYGQDRVTVLTSSSPLPVELASFRAESVGSAVRLAWATVSETNNAAFRVQRTIDPPGPSQRWRTVGEVAGHGTVTEPRSYVFLDDDLPYAANRITYRLEQVDMDGRTSYSGERTVARPVRTVEFLDIFPTPARDRVTLRYGIPTRRPLTVGIFDVLGRRVRVLDLGPQQGRHEVSVDVSALPGGLYFVRIRAGSHARSQPLIVAP